MTDFHIRATAESLLNSVTSPPYYRNYNSHSQSINLVTEDLVAGHRPQGYMSTVRRFFCLFVTFDLLFTSLMWLICVMLRGETLEQIFNREILHYNIKSSLFDIVVVAIARFTVLLLFYALLYINNWSVIALSTGLTCAFLIAKVFLFDWPDAAQPVYQVFLILSSFTLAWSEAWFLDFRVLPQELQARHILDAIANQNQATERAPLLPSQGVQSMGDSSNWLSPLDSPASTPRGRDKPREVILTQELIEEYKVAADEGVQNGWRVMQSPNWKTEKKGSVRGDIIESTNTERFGKVYRFTGIVDCPAKFLFTELRDNITKLPEWNPTILKSEIIKELDDGVDLSYQVTAGGGRGIIAPRDFVILRRCAPLARDGAPCAPPHAPHCYICSGISVEVPGYPPNKDMVRGHNKIGCWILKPMLVKNAAGVAEEKTLFQWLMCCDLKGKIPQFVLDTAFATVMLDYIVYVRKHCTNARAKGLF